MITANLTSLITPKGMVSQIKIGSKTISIGGAYTQLEYIQSTGTQYIDTGFKPNQDTRVVMDIDLTATSGIKALFGGRDGDTSSDKSFVVWQFSGTTFRTDFNTNNVTATVSSTAGRFLIDKNKTITTINGTEYVNTSSAFQSSYNLSLLTLIDPSGPDTRMASGKLYSCQIYDNGTLIRDYVPAQWNETGEFGLYDKVNNKFYSNAGTGSFTGA